MSGLDWLLVFTLLLSLLLATAHGFLFELFSLAGVGIEVSEDEFADHWIRTGLGIEDFVRLRGLAHDPETLRRSKFPPSVAPKYAIAASASAPRIERSSSTVHT